MRILGIDPGVATVGFGVIENSSEDKHKVLDYGCITTKAGLPFSVRLQQIHRDLKIIMNKWQPAEIAIEEIFFSKNVKTGIKVAQARGAMMQQVLLEKRKVAEYKPQEIKEAVCGYGRADKKQLQKMVQLILEMEETPKPDDAADALAIAICHANNLRWLRATRMSEGFLART